MTESTVVSEMEGKLTIAVSADDHVAGPADAPLTLVEYGDYQCPDCFAARVVVDEVRWRLSGSLRVVWRHFPIASVHPLAEQAAEVAEAAADQGRFWEMHDKLLTYQGRLNGELLDIWARRLGLDVDRLRADLRARRYEARIREQRQGGVQSGVRSTPTFFINGIRYEGRIGPNDLYEALAGHLE